MIISGGERQPNRSFFLRCPLYFAPASLANVERYGIGAQRLRCDVRGCSGEAFAHVWSEVGVRPSSAGLRARIKRSIGRR
jgi:hypothetical protein